MTELPSEPSVSTVKEQLEKHPVTEEQKELLMTHLRDQPGNGMTELLRNIENYPSVFPDSSIAYFMKMRGMEVNDPRILRMISIATQKFISDIIVDCMIQAKQKGQGTNPSKSIVLTEELLLASMKERGLDVTKAPYHL